MKRYVYLLSVTCLVLGALRPALTAPTAQVPPAPDYSRGESWAAWPGRSSGADAVPPGVTERGDQAAPPVDVFFIHPTTFLSRHLSNARYDEPGATSEFIDRGVLRFQAGAFNDCCRLYAPHYRQAALAAFFHHDDAADSAALDLAYGDVVRAFDYYIEHENHGRPFIIAAHSQGSLHALRLVQERIAGHVLRQRMVAAYIVGYAVPRSVTQTGVPICDRADSTGCIISWNTVKPEATDAKDHDEHLIWLDGRYQRLGTRRTVCINPLTWTPDSDANAAANLGALPGVRPYQDLQAVVPALTGAACVNDELTVSIPWGHRRGFADLLTLFGSYHIYDYNLFYANIRANADQRTLAFLSQGDRP